MVIHTLHPSLKKFSHGDSLQKKMPLVWSDLNYCFDSSISSITLCNYLICAVNLTEPYCLFSKNEENTAHTRQPSRLANHTHTYMIYTHICMYDKLNNWKNKLYYQLSPCLFCKSHEEFHENRRVISHY